MVRLWLRSRVRVVPGDITCVSVRSRTRVRYRTRVRSRTRVSSRARVRHRARVRTFF